MLYLRQLFTPNHKTISHQINTSLFRQPGYYDLNYQTPTSLGAAGVRDASLGSVAYSTMSDGRFTRTDNNSSPVSNVCT